MAGFQDFLKNNLFGAATRAGIERQMRELQLQEERRAMQDRDRARSLFYGQPNDVTVTPRVTEDTKKLPAFGTDEWEQRYDPQGPNTGILGRLPRSSRALAEGIMAMDPVKGMAFAAEQMTPKEQWQQFGPEADPFGLGGSGQKSSLTGKVENYQALEPPQRSQVPRGGNLDTEQWNPKSGKFEVIGTGPRWAPPESESGPRRVHSLIPAGDGTYIRQWSDGPAERVTIDGKVITGVTNNPQLQGDIALERRRAATRADREKAFPKVSAAQSALVAQRKLVTDAIRSLIGTDGKSGALNAFNTGIGAKAFANVPGTTPYNISRTLETIKANIGFDKLQQMRDASPTGGALGPVSDYENRNLQSVLGSLDQFQGEQQVRQNLTKLLGILDEMDKARQSAFQQEYADIIGGGGGAGGPQPGTVDDGFRFKGGNPADPNNWEKVQ